MRYDSTWLTGYLPQCSAFMDMCGLTWWRQMVQVRHIVNRELLALSRPELLAP